MKQIYVIGAGASKHAGYPLINDFVDTIFALPEPKASYLWSRLATLKNFRNRFLPDGNIEELLAFAEFLRYTDYIDLSSLVLTFDDIPRDYLVPSVQLGILYLFSELAKKKNRSEVYDEFVKSLNGAILSFNWDFLIDESLKYAKGILWPECIEGYFHDNKLSDVSYLKLHGSANTIWCPNPMCDFYKRENPEEILRILEGSSDQKCPKCHGKWNNVHYFLEPFFVGPSLDKGSAMYRMGLLKSQWYLARKMLIDCERIIFIGLSFAASDFHLVTLFRSAIAGRQSKTLSIEVVNPSDSPDLVRRYLNLFLSSDLYEERRTEYSGKRYDCSIFLKFIKQSFEDFVEAKKSN